MIKTKSLHIAQIPNKNEHVSHLFTFTVADTKCSRSGDMVELQEELTRCLRRVHR